MFSHLNRPKLKLSQYKMNIQGITINISTLTWKKIIDDYLVHYTSCTVAVQKDSSFQIMQSRPNAFYNNKKINKFSNLPLDFSKPSDY